MSRVRFLGIGALLSGVLLFGPTPAHAGGLFFIQSESIFSPIAVAISPNGFNVYTILTNGVIAVWNRDPPTNTISLNEVEADGIGGVDGMQEPQGVAVSPDGACVYVATGNDEPGPGGPGTVVSFSRSLLDGTLTFVGFVEDDAGGVDGIGLASDVVVSPNSAHVYVAGRGDDAVAVFSQIGCALTFIEAEVNGIGGVDGLNSPNKLAISADGLHVYAGAQGTVAVFSRALTGTLSFVEFEDNGIAGVKGLGGRVEGLAVSPDGDNVYAGSQGDAVVAFTRDSGTGALSYLETEYAGGLAKGFKNASGLAVSPDNAYVYVVGKQDGALAVFVRNTATGTLDFLEFHNKPVPGTNVLDGVEDVAVSPDGTGVYVVGFQAFTLVAFAADRCGDDFVGIDEQCDDGCLAGTPNVCEPADDGDGCSAACKLELCSPTPTGTCHTATPLGGAALQIKDQAEDPKDQLKWKWKGQTTPLAQYGNPVIFTTYVICVYDGSGNPQPLLSQAAPFGGTCSGKDCWSAKTTGYQYSDKSLTPDGLKSVKLKEGLIDGKAQVQVQGAGIFLRLPTLPLTPPVTVQVKNTQNTECWQAVYSATEKNEAAEFKAKSD